MCRQPKPLKQICETFDDVPPDKIRSFLAMMVDKRLMFEEEDWFLSLAVSEMAKRIVHSVPYTGGY